MKVIFCIALFLTFLAVAHGQVQSQRSVSELVKSSVDSVVLIVVSDESGKPLAEGSGFIVSADGKIVTNHHVIAAAHSAIVKLNNGAFFAVDGVLADDPDQDLAVIKVSGNNLPSLVLADSDSLSVGDHVIAIGSPLGLENSVSDGIISGFREGTHGRSWLQTTAPASHGNSGGPLITMEGRVAGVVTWKASEGENLNFAVPSKLIRPLLVSSTAQPLGTVTVGATVSTAKSEDLWTSMTSGHDFKVRIDGDYLYLDRTDFPPALVSEGAFQRAELKKIGDKWVGKNRSNEPFQYGIGTKWCRFEYDIEIDKLSDARIEGQDQVPTSIDVRKCQMEKMDWKPIVLIPK